jgi:hypothetical protein
MGIKNKKPNSKNPVVVKIVNDGEWCETCTKPGIFCRNGCSSIAIDPKRWQKMCSQNYY